MPKIQMVETASGPQQVGKPLQTLTDRAAQQNQRTVPGLGSVDTVRDELDDVWRAMGEFSTSEPDEVMQRCAAFTARLGEIRMRIQRVEDLYPYWKPIRTREVDPALDELKFQFQVASRLHSVRQFDFEMARGF